MITNERQYKIAKSRMASVEGQISDLTGLVESGSLPTDWEPIARADLEGTLMRIRGEIEDYERLKESGPGSVRVGSLREVPDALVRARVAAGLTQKQLADLVGLKEQQIQRYEATVYSGANIDRILQVADVLDVRVEGDEATRKLTVAQFFTALGLVGFPREFALERLLSPELADEIEGTNSQETAVCVEHAIDQVERILNWRPGEPSSVGLTQSAAVRFKIAANTNLSRIVPYVAYARFLAEQVVVACDWSTSTASNSVDEVEQRLMAWPEPLSFRDLLAFVWDQGTPVLPLSDPGKFHGACWRLRGRNVIALKQRTESVDRWIFDLLHELRHSLETPSEATREIVDVEAPATADDENDEREANEFATRILLRGQADRLRADVLASLRYSGATFEGAVRNVAQDAQVRPGALANYLAYHLGSEMGINLWARIRPLEESGDPRGTAESFLAERLKLERLDKHARFVVQRALGVA